jgi:hypothetical protein
MEFSLLSITLVKFHLSKLLTKTMIVVPFGIKSSLNLVEIQKTNFASNNLTKTTSLLTVLKMLAVICTQKLLSKGKS